MHWQEKKNKPHTHTRAQAHTHTHARASSLNFEHSLRISLWSFDSISVLRETDEIRALTSTHERSSHKHTHARARTHSKTRSLFEEMTSSSAAVSPGVKAGWKPVPSQRRLPRRMVITHLMRDCYDEGDYGYTPQPAPPPTLPPTPELD